MADRVVAQGVSAPRAPVRTVFYGGGYEAIGGIEAFLYDLLTNAPAAHAGQALLVWARDLPQLRAIERAGTRVLRTPLRWGCRFGLPDALLFARHGRALRGAGRIVLTKIPPAPVFARIAAAARSRGTDIVYVTPYRPREMWPDGIPRDLRDGLDRILVQGAEFAEDLREAGFRGAIDIVPYIPPPAAVDPPDPPRADRPFRLGFLGRFVAQKNLFYLLDILDALAPEPIELHMFGEGEDGQALRDAAGARALPVHFHGAIPREEVPAAIERCDAFINPSISEGQCLVALEVTSRGRPFIATPVGAVPDILAKGRLGVAIPLGDAAGAALIVRDLVREWRAGGWRARTIAEAYRTAYPRPDILEAYARLLWRARDDQAVGAAPARAGQDRS